MEKENNNTQEYTMNVKPELGRWANWRNKRNLQAIARREKKAIEKQQEKEKRANGEITKKQVRENAILTGVLGAELLVAIGLSAAFFATAPFAAGILAATSLFAGFSLAASLSDTIDKYKEYKKTHPAEQKPKKEKKTKEKKSKAKTLGLGKRIKNFFSKSKNKTEDGTETAKEQPTPANKPELTMPLPTEETVENKSVSSDDDIKSANYTLDPNGPEVVSVDLSNIDTKPGLNIVPYHFIVKKDDKIMNEIIEQYIEKTTGCPAMYADKVIDNEEKRVYMLTK